MGIRHRAREIAMQALFYMDICKDDRNDQLELFCSNINIPKKSLAFFKKIVNGVLNANSEIDRIIELYSSNWKIHRMSCVDRNILRIAVYELIYCSDIPAKVIINEAIEVGKKFGTEDSGSFINGVLDTINKKKAEINIDSSLKQIKEK